jgi:hypothetical protein
VIIDNGIIMPTWKPDCRRKKLCAGTLEAFLDNTPATTPAGKEPGLHPSFSCKKFCAVTLEIFTAIITDQD